MKRIILATLASGFALAGAAQASPGNGNGNGNGHKKFDRGQSAQPAHRGNGNQRHKSNNGTGWGVGEVPPGHRFRHGDRLPSGYREISDYSRYGLPDPGEGYRYVRYDGEIFRTLVGTAIVAGAFGLISNLVN